MITAQAQLKITLPLNLLDLLKSKAEKLGLPVAAYLRHLVVEDVKDEVLENKYPVFRASKATERAARKALEDYKKGKVVWVDDIDKFFRDLGK